MYDMNEIEKVVEELKKLHLEITELETSLQTKKERSYVLKKEVFREINVVAGVDLLAYKRLPRSAVSVQPKYLAVSITSTIQSLVNSSPHGITTGEIVNEIYGTIDEPTRRVVSTRISALLSRLTREGKVIRPSKGVYKSS